MYVVLHNCSPSTDPLQSGTKRKMGQEECANCGRRVFLAERMQVETRVFHRSCFRCMVCNLTLRPGAHRFDGGQFYCSAHYTTMKRSRDIKKAIEERGISEQALYAVVKKPKTGSPPPAHPQQQPEPRAPTIPRRQQQQEQPVPALPPKQKQQQQQSSPPPQSDYDDPMPVYTAVMKETPVDKDPMRSALSKVLMDAAAAKQAKDEERAPSKVAPSLTKEQKDGERPVALDDLSPGHYETDPQYMEKRKLKMSEQFYDALLPVDTAAAKKTSEANKMTDTEEAPGRAAPLHTKEQKGAVRPMKLEDLPPGHYETDPEYMQKRRVKMAEPELDEYEYVVPPNDVRVGTDTEYISPALPVNPPPLKGKSEATAPATKPAVMSAGDITQSQIERAKETVGDAKRRRPPPPRPAPFTRRPPPAPRGALNVPPAAKKVRHKKKKKITLEQIDVELQRISDKQQQLEERGVVLEQEIRENYDSRLTVYVGVVVTIALSSSPFSLAVILNLPYFVILLQKTMLPHL